MNAPSMDSWYSKDLGDGMMAVAPSAEIAEAFLRFFNEAGEPPDMAVFTRLESEGRLHCEMTAYFSPAAHVLAQAFDAQPCAKPARAGLGLLAGNETAWSMLFSNKE